MAIKQMQMLGELFFANQERKMGVMPSIITILWTQSGGKRGNVESSFILSIFLEGIPVIIRRKWRLLVLAQSRVWRPTLWLQLPLRSDERIRQRHVRVPISR